MTDVDCIALVSFGGPEGPDDVLPFLENVTRGRGIPAERLQAVAEHYYSFGGVSPINEQNRALLSAMRVELDARGITLPLYWGNRNWKPNLGDAFTEISEAGLTHPFAITTSAYSSYSGCRQYRENLEAAATGCPGVTFDKAPAYFDRPGFIQPFATGLCEALRELSASGITAAETVIFFTTHSIPVSMAETSGPTGGSYVAQHMHVAQRVIDETQAELGDQAVPAWSLVYQSRSGAPQIPWLEPDINDAIRECSSTTRAVVIVPIGFISDHLEVVWDLDHEARATCESMGLTMLRVPTPGTSPSFVSTLVDLVSERLAGTAQTCPANCCPPPRR